MDINFVDFQNRSIIIDVQWNCHVENDYETTTAGVDVQYPINRIYINIAASVTDKSVGP